MTARSTKRPEPAPGGLHVQYGCGLSCPDGWMNFDASPTLRAQKIPLFGLALKRRVPFPDDVYFGDVTKGLPLADEVCAGVYASHVLEHLACDDFWKALQETYRICAPGACFRAVVPDLFAAAQDYVVAAGSGDPSAATEFFRQTLLGVERRPRTLTDFAKEMFGNSRHLTMWDAPSLMDAMLRTGFRHARLAECGDSSDPAFSAVEDESRFVRAVCIEAIK